MSVGGAFPFASSAHLCQTPFCQSVLLLPSVTWQQNWIIGGKVPPVSVSDVIGHRKKKMNERKDESPKI